nr:MAG: major capsid protein [Microvirus sp.]
MSTKRGGLFTTIATKKPKKSLFDLSFDNKLSLDMGKLVPILTQEVVPGDKFQLQAQIMLRFAPMLAPIMHRVDVYTHYFFVPNRLIWNDWEDFITGGKDGTLAPVPPHFNMFETKMNGKGDLLKPGTLFDYIGCPAVSNPTIINSGVGASSISSLPFRAYQLIYNEYYRDQNLMDEVDFGKGSGKENHAIIEKLLSLRNRCWQKDYFTSALPWTQRGVEVSLPIAGEANVIANSQAASGTNSAHFRAIYAQNGTIPANGTLETDTQGNILANVGTDNGPIRIVPVAGLDGEYPLIADLENATAVTMNELRRAEKLQQWLEKNARGGARYVEQILSHFGVVSSDARLQRPEYLGGGKTPVVISEVLQTSASQEDSAQANPAGNGISVGTSHRFNKYFEEHGFIIGIMSVLPKTAYQQGLPRMFQREDKFDYYYPEFAHLGEQEVLNSEVYLDPTAADSQYNKGTFGYQSRYAEYKYNPDTVHGDFRESLNFWHLGRIFNTAGPDGEGVGRPVLNKEFVESSPSNRIFNVTTDDVNHLWAEVYQDIKAIRPMPKYGTPQF